MHLFNKLQDKAKLTNLPYRYIKVTPVPATAKCPEEANSYAVEWDYLDPKTGKNQITIVSVWSTFSESGGIWGIKVSYI